MAFWERKMRTYFARIDLNNDGKISKEDFEDMANKFIAGGYVKDENKATFTANICGIWDSYLAKLGGDGISQAGFLESAKKLAADAEGEKIIKGALTNFFHAIDTDGDAQISKTEFELFYRIIGLDTSFAAASFAAIDENSDDNLSLDEFTTAGFQFFKSTDEASPTKVFWGPLVD